MKLILAILSVILACVFTILGAGIVVIALFLAQYTEEYAVTWVIAVCGGLTMVCGWFWWVDAHKKLCKRLKGIP